MSFKIPCGGFKLDEESFSLDENGVLSVSGGGGVSPEEVAAIVKEQFPHIKEQFIVTFSTEDMQNWTCDKTLAEITEAINSGKEVVGSLMGKMKVDFLEQAANGSAVFGRVSPGLGTLMSYHIVVSEAKVEVTMASIEMTVMGG